MIPSTNRDSLEVHRALRTYRAWHVASLVLIFTAKAAAVLLSALIVLQLLFALIPWTLIPVLWDLSIGVACLSIAGFILHKELVSKPSLLSIARILEKKAYGTASGGAGFPRCLLSLALELELPGALGSPDLKARAMSIARDQLAKLPRFIGQKPSRGLLTALAALSVAWISTTVTVKPGCAEYWKLPLSIGAKPQARIFPGSVWAPLHSSITIGCIPSAGTFPSCRAIITNLGDSSRQDAVLRPDSLGRFCLTRDHLTSSFSYAFILGTFAFAPETVRVVPPPMIFSLNISVKPPAYVHLPVQTIPEGQGNFSAYYGSMARISLSATGGLASARLCPAKGDTVALNVKGPFARGEIKITGMTSYTFKLVDTLGQKSDSLPTWYIDLTPDLPPMVHFLKPGKNLELSPALQETLAVEAIDDIGLEKLDLRWRKNSDPTDSLRRRDLLPGMAGQKAVRVGFAWDLQDASLYPGDTVFYWAFAKDNYPFDTLHRATTETFWFRIPGFDEIHRRLAQEETSTAGALKSVRTEQDNIKNELSRLIQSTHGKQSLSWEQKQVIKDLRESLRAQSDTLSKAVSSLKQTMEKLKEQGVSGKDITDKMDKVRAALEDLARQYGDSLFSPPRATDRVSMQELKASLEKLEKMLPDLSKRLDSALKYLEMLQRDRRLAAMAMQAQKLGEQQAALAVDQKSERAKARQKDLLKRIDSLVSEISRSFDSTGLLQKNDAPALAQASQRAQSMENALSNGVLPEPSDMNNMGAELFSLADNLRDLQSTAMMAKIKKDQDALMEISHNALHMSEWQEQIASETHQTGSRVHIAQMQEALRQAILKSAEALNSLSMTPPQTLSGLMRQFDKAAQSAGKSLDEMGENGDPSERMLKSEESLNALAFSLMSAAGSIDGAQGEQGDGEPGMMAGMQKLSGKQAMINGATGEILRQMLGEGGPPGEGGQGAMQAGGASEGSAEKARRQAQAAQKEIADELQKLSEKYGKEAGGSFDKRAKDLEDEARRLAKMLDDPKPEIRDRQDRFLSRMLESSVSLHKQDEGKDERTSQSAKTVFSIDDKPSGVGDGVDRDSFYRLRQKAFMSGFPESYRSAVKNYFDSLGTLFLK